MRRDAIMEVEVAPYGFVLIGTRKLPVRKPDRRRAIASTDAGPASSAGRHANTGTVEPNHKGIEDLFREARAG